MQILVLGAKEYAAIYKLNLETFLGLNVILKKNIDESPTDVLASSLIISPSPKEDELGSTLNKFMSSQDLDTPIIYIGEGKFERDKSYNLKSWSNVKVLVHTASKALNVKIVDQKEKYSSGIKNIDLDILKGLKNCPISLFMRVEGRGSQFEFVKLYDKEQIYNPDIVSSLEKKGVSEIYIKAPDYIPLINFITESFIKSLNTDSLTLIEKLELSDNASNFIRDIVLSFGVTEEVLKLSDAVAKNFITFCRNTPSLKKMFQILSNPSNVTLSSRAQFISTMGIQYLIKENKWNNENFFIKFAYAAYLHDLLIPNTKHHFIDSDEKLEASHLSGKEEKLILQHANLMSDYVNTSGMFPSEVSTIIKQHHGSKNGIGFDYANPEGIHPFSQIFIVIESLCNLTFSQKNNAELLPEKLFEQIKKDLIHQKYQEIIDRFLQIIKRA
ncbi:MAG: hypothetical protein H6622_16650 [Halobacteriovoraceae bacterium]|nr:hypothetical protein [Halobacteriovoraceae bacterium]